MFWISEILVTWKTFRPPDVASMGIDSLAHTGFRFENILGVCTKATFHQINYAVIFACNKFIFFIFQMCFAL